MTIGQRIAHKRKELGLSQEGLGDRLGVSRQSIYKWESDTALPEIDKLIALSRLFGVSVGWLLGVEESPSPEADPSGELTEQQLHMVEELVRRYSGTRGLSPRRRKVLKLAVAVGAVCLAGVLYSLFSQLGRLDQQYTDLQNSIYRVESSVDGQIGSISSRVEEILKAQNSLVTDAGVELKLVSLSDGDPGAAVFSAYAVPRTYQEGMTAEFHIENGTGGVQTVPGVLHPDGRTFRADSLSCALTDDIRVSVVFIAPDGTRSTQLLDQFDGLYGGTLPSARVREYSHGNLLGLEANSSGLLTLPEHWVTVSVSSSRTASEGQILPQAGAETVQVGLFKNKALVTWLEPAEKPESFHGDFEGEDFYHLPEGQQVTMTSPSTDQLCFAAVLTDEYGRQVVYPSIPYVLEGGSLTWVSGADLSGASPAVWRFDS